MEKKKINKNIIPNIRGINIYNIYQNFSFIKKIKKYIKYINNIKILIKYNKIINIKKFINIIKICNKKNINLTINIKLYNFKKKNKIKYIKYIKYIINNLNIKKIFISINLQCKNINEWYLFYKDFIYIYNLKKINNIIFINYPNNFKYPNYLILYKIKKIFNIFKKNNIFLLISIYNKIYRKIKNLIQFLNCIINKNIPIVLSEINYINNIKFLLNFCQKKNINWWITPKKYKNINKKINISNISSIIFCKNGIRQTSIKNPYPYNYYG